MMMHIDMDFRASSLTSYCLALLDLERIDHIASSLTPSSGLSLNRVFLKPCNDINSRTIRRHPVPDFALRNPDTTRTQAPRTS